MFLPCQRYWIKNYLSAGISAKRPEISLNASAQRDVESAIIETLKPISLKYSESVIPKTKSNNQ